jgi:hypothetical protein
MHPDHLFKRMRLIAEDYGSAEHLAHPCTSAQMRRSPKHGGAAPDNVTTYVMEPWAEPIRFTQAAAASQGRLLQRRGDLNVFKQGGFTAQAAAQIDALMTYLLARKHVAGSEQKK